MTTSSKKSWTPAHISTVGAEDSRFPSGETLHWTALRKIPHTVREVLSFTNDVLSQIENDINLSPEGKKAQSAIVAREAVAKLEKLAEPDSSVSRRMKALNDKINEQLASKPKDAAETAQMAEIRAHLARQDKPAMAALKLAKSEPKVAAAVLDGPGFLSGMSDDEVKALRREVTRELEQQKEIDSINGAVAVGRRAIKSARAMITERTGAVLDSPAPAAAAKK